MDINLWLIKKNYVGLHLFICLAYVEKLKLTHFEGTSTMQNPLPLVENIHRLTNIIYVFVSVLILFMSAHLKQDWHMEYSLG